MNKEAIAAEASLEYARRIGMDNCSSDFPNADYPHLESMRLAMERMEDPLKRNRYLGWIQACICVYAQNDEAFDEMLNLNRAIFR